MKKNIKKIIVGALLFPAFAFAAGATVNSLTSFITAIGGIIKQIVPLILALAVLYVIWNTFHYISAGNAGDEKARGVALNNIIYSAVAMFLMMSIWGLVGVLQGTISFTPATIPASGITPLQ